MKNYLYVSIAFFSLFSETYTWCPSEVEYELPTANLTSEYLDALETELDRVAKASQDYKSKKRKIESVTDNNSSNNNKQDNYSTPDLYKDNNDYDDEPSTQKESDSEQEETIPVINERTPKILRLDIRKKSAATVDTISLDARIKRFKNTRKQAARRLGTQDNLSKSGLLHLLNPDLNNVYETF